MRSIWKIAISICCAVLILSLIGLQVYRLRSRKLKLIQGAEACRLRAESGDAKAEYELSRRYFYGAGVGQDYSEAYRWARKAADQGLATAQTALASWYLHGFNVPQSDSEAYRWYSAASAQGETAGEYGLGYMYRHGLGVKRDDQEAIVWIRKSAEQGYAQAECELGYMYQKGFGVQQDDSQAATWYRKAAEQGDARAESAIGFMEFYGYGVTANRHGANLWFHKAAEQGDAYARSTLGIVWLGMTTTQLVFFLVQIAGGILLLISSFVSQQKNSRFRSNAAIWAGSLCLVSAGVWWFGFNHYAIRSFNWGLNTFTLFKFLLDGAAIVMLKNVLRGERTHG